MARIPLVDEEGNPTGEFETRERLHKQRKNGLENRIDIHPQGHTIIYNRSGNVLVG